MDISPALAVDDLLHGFIENDLLPGTGIAPAAFWAALESVLADFTPRNTALLAKRDTLQDQVDAWWRDRKGKAVSAAEQQAFLKEIPDAHFRESARDFMVNQQFRRDYWVKGARKLAPVSLTYW
jgi:malate synthase